MSIVEAARTLAYRAHDGQYRKSGKHFFTHPSNVAGRMTTDYEKAVAFLHDVLEMTNITAQDLRIAGVPDGIIAAVEAITRNDGETYMDYIKRCKLDPVARAVKIEDIRDNLNDMPTNTMIVRYGKALEILLQDDTPT